MTLIISQKKIKHFYYDTIWTKKIHSGDHTQGVAYNETYVLGVQESVQVDQVSDNVW